MTKDSNKELTAVIFLALFNHRWYRGALSQSEYIGEFVTEWHKQECKKWALECVPEIEKAHTSGSENAVVYYVTIAGQESMRDRMIKKIEEKSK